MVFDSSIEAEEIMRAVSLFRRGELAAETGEKLELLSVA